MFILLSPTVRYMIHFELLSFHMMWASSFACWYPVVPVPFVENTIFSLWTVLASCLNQLIINVKDYYSWTLSSTLLIYLAILMPALHYSFMVNFKIEKYKSTKFVFFFQDYFWLFRVSFISIWILESSSKLLQKKSETLLKTVLNL